MTRLLARIPRRRAPRDADAPEAAAASAVAQSPTAEQPAADTGAPAGTEPNAPPRTGFRERSRLRRRLRYLRRVRELGFRDLGGLVFDQHRFGRPDESLVQAKLTALAAVDGELRAIELALRDERPITELREVGVSACARCGALIGSDARFCSSCGAAVRGARDIAAVVADTTTFAPPRSDPAPPAPGEPTPSRSVEPTPLAARLGAWSAGAAPAAGSQEQATPTGGAEPRPDGPDGA